MSDDDVAIRIKVLDQQRASAALKSTAKDVRGVGTAARDSSTHIDRSARATNRQTRSFASLRASGRGVSSSIGLVTRSVGGMLATVGGVYAAGSAFRFAFGEATESAKVGAQTNAVIKSTGKAAGITAKHVGNLATRISNYAGIDDEAIQQGENLLLTFTKIRNGVGKGNHVFDQATVAATNMGVALGTDTASAAMMLGKALNDPAKGYSRLMRSGVSFTQQQIDQIKTLQKNGKMMDAQKIILREVNKEFGGSAAAQAQPLEKVKVALSNVAEAAGGVLLPAVNKLLTPMARFLNGITQGTGAGGRFAKRMDQVGGAIRATLGWVTGTGIPAVRGAVQEMMPTIVQIVGWLRETGRQAVSAFTAAVGPMRSVGTAIQLVAQRWWQLANIIASVVWPIVQRVMPAVRQTVVGAMQVIGGALRVVAAIIHGDFSGALKGLGSIAKGAMNMIVGTIRSVTAPLRAAASAAFGVIKEAFRAAVNWVIRGWNSLQFKLPSVNTHIPGVGKIGGGAVGVPQVPMLAAGGTVARAGTALVGERGPELLSLPRGATVQPLQSMAAPSFDLGTIMEHVQITAHVHSYIDGREAAYGVETVQADAEARR